MNPPDHGTTTRAQAKAERREALLRSAASLFAERGYSRVSLDDLGAAVGISGPALYRHFAGKQAVLAALLIEVSEALHDGGTIVVETTTDAAETLTALVAFHVDFALANPAVIRVQDRDLDSLGEQEQHRVRTLQRRYVELWVGVLARIHPGADTAGLRLRAQATFGLINSTPHSAAGADTARARGLLESMALAALTTSVRR